MAKSALFMENKNTWIGRYVYQNFKPNEIGKITEIITAKPFDKVKVKWENGSELIAPINYFRDIQYLIDDHERKLNKHKEHLKKVKEIIG